MTLSPRGRLRTARVPRLLVVLGAALFLTTMLVIAPGVVGGPAANADPGASDSLPPVTAIAAGEGHTCAIAEIGTVYCWGTNAQGQLGAGIFQSQSNTPVQVAGISGVTALTVGYDHNCAIAGGGAVYCWGSGDNGQLGDGAKMNRWAPVQVAGITGATSIAAGVVHTCAIAGGGDVYCWGSGNYGRLGDGTADPSDYLGAGQEHLTPVQVPGITGAVAITVGWSHTCVITTGGTVRCWGYNSGSQVRAGDWIEPSPVQVAGVTGAIDITAGLSHTCAIVTGGIARCWGTGNSGQLGDGSTQVALTPVQVSGITGVTDITAGAFHNCAITAGIARCWGSGSNGELGDGSTQDRWSPVQVAEITGVTDITAGRYQHTCAVVTGGDAYCWGSGSSGQLGEGSTQDRLTPVQVGAPPSNGCAGTTYFLGVRGSGEDPQPGSGDGDANGSHPSGMVQQLADEFGLFFYGADRPNRGIGTPVGAVSGYVGKSSRDTFVPLGIAYPAVEVEIGALDYPINYRSSVDLGAAGVHTVLSRLKSYCGAELPKVILSGYSQGAHVIEDALAWINDNDPALAALVTKTVLIASPVHRASGPENIGGANTAGALVHTRKPGTDAFVNAHPGVVTSICRPGDLVCDASFADGLSDPTTFIGINPQNGLGARIHTSYELSDIACPYTSLQQFTTICAANSALQALGRPLNTHTASTQPGTSTDLDRQYSTRPGQKIDIVYTAKSGVSTGVSKIVNVFMYSAPTDLGSFEIGDDGFAAGTITIPASTPPGQHTLVLRRGDGETFTRAIVVDAAAGEPASALLLTVDGDSPDSEPYPVDPETPEPPIPGSGSLGSGSLGGS